MFFECFRQCENASNLPQATSPLASLGAQLSAPDDRVDFATAKLAIDQLIDPGTDAAAIEQELDRWERAIRYNIPVGANGRQTLDALLRTLYQPGPWNDGRPFTYDLDDPLGKEPANKRVATNAMKATSATPALARRHWTTKFTCALCGPEKRGGHGQPPDGHYARERDGESLMALADLALEANPKDTVAMIWRANAAYLLIQSRYKQRYPRPEDIPPVLIGEYQRLGQENHAWFAKAEALGWAQKTPEQDAA